MDKNKIFNLEEIKSIIREISSLMDELNLKTVEIQIKEACLKLEKQPSFPGNTAATSQNQHPLTKDKTENGSAENIHTITSPLVGTFYGSPSPDLAPYVSVEEKVTPETVVGLIDMMKVMNEIMAEISGTVIEVLVKNGQAVEHGTPLFKVKLDN
jgi:acetyl-CoA carboxylase biotin carboxyl carrier protein